MLAISDEIGNCIPFPNMQASSGDVIASDEERRSIKYYDIISNYKENPSKIQLFTITTNSSEMGKISFEHDALVYHVNKGRITFVPGGKTEPEPFNYCTACNQWIRKTRIEDHLTEGSRDPCKNQATQDDVTENLMLLVQGSHDVLKIDIPCPEAISQKGENAILEFYYTLLEIIDQSILLTYNLTDDEIAGFVNPDSKDLNSSNKSIIIYETDEGGTGVVKSLLRNPVWWNSFITKVAGLIHLRPTFPYEETDDACDKVCYNCLLGYWNQKHHYFLNRHRVIEFVKLLMNSEIKETDDTDAEAVDKHMKSLLDRGLDSNLEKRVIQSLKDFHIPLPDHVQFTINDKNSIPITKADFYYSKKRLAIFVDGPPHNPGKFPEQAEKDNNKRRQIKRFGYEVFVLDFFTNIGENDPISDKRIKEELMKLKNHLDP